MPDKMNEIIINKTSLLRYHVIPRDLSIMLPNVKTKKKQATDFIIFSESR